MFYFSEVIFVGCRTNLDRLRVGGHDDAEVLCHPVQQVAPHPQVVAHLYALAWADLKLPLETENS